MKKAAALAGPLSPRTKLDGAVEWSRATDLVLFQNLPEHAGPHVIALLRLTLCALP
jgi:hypothetical protein